MMPKQLPNMSQDIETKKDAAAYAACVMNKLKAVDIEQAISTAYLMGAANGYCTGCRCSDIEAEKDYWEVIRQLKKKTEYPIAMNREEFTKTIEVPLWELREIANTLRIVANALDSPKRESCLDRNVMRSWNNVVDMINGHTPSISESVRYYNKVGQIPNINEYQISTNNNK